MHKKLFDAAVKGIRNDIKNSMQVKETNIEELEKEKSILSKKIYDVYFGLRHDEMKINALEEYLCISRALNQSIVRQRKLVIKLYEQSQKDTITIHKTKELIEQCSEQRVQLKKLCDHTLILQFSAYEGSRSDDYDDQYDELRICVICNHRDSRNIPDGSYKSLVHSPARVIRRGRRNNKSEIIFDFWQPLSEIIPLFITPNIKKIKEEIEQYISSQNPS